MFFLAGEFSRHFLQQVLPHSNLPLTYTSTCFNSYILAQNAARL
jgi:hypothetical protein